MSDNGQMKLSTSSRLLAVCIEEIILILTVKKKKSLEPENVNKKA